jgi:hypothetical protein
METRLVEKEDPRIPLNDVIENMTNQLGAEVCAIWGCLPIIPMKAVKFGGMTGFSSDQFELGALLNSFINFNNNKHPHTHAPMSIRDVGTRFLPDAVLIARVDELLEKNHYTRNDLLAHYKLTPSLYASLLKFNGEDYDDKQCKTNFQKNMQFLKHSILHSPVYGMLLYSFWKMYLGYACRTYTFEKDRIENTYLEEVNPFIRENYISSLVATAFLTLGSSIVAAKYFHKHSRQNYPVESPLNFIVYEGLIQRYYSRYADKLAEKFKNNFVSMVMFLVAILGLESLTNYFGLMNSVGIPFENFIPENSVNPWIAEVCENAVSQTTAAVIGIALPAITYQAARAVGFFKTRTPEAKIALELEELAAQDYDYINRERKFA